MSVYSLTKEGKPCSAGLWKPNRENLRGEPKRPAPNLRYSLHSQTKARPSFRMTVVMVPLQMGQRLGQVSILLFATIEVRYSCQLVPTAASFEKVEVRTANCASLSLKGYNNKAQGTAVRTVRPEKVFALRGHNQGPTGVLFGLKKSTTGCASLDFV